MFQVRHSNERPFGQLVTSAVLGAVILALLLNSGALLLVAREYRLLGAWADEPQPLATAGLQALRSEVLLQMTFAVVVWITLLSCAVTLVWFRRRDFASQQTLRDVKTLAYNILASVDQGVITSDLDSTITGVNSAAIRLLGIGSDCVGQRLSQVCPLGLALEQESQQLAQRQLPIRDRDLTLHRDGRSLRYRADAHFLNDSAGQPLGCVFLLRDVTERVLLEERMARMERFISLGTLASGLHHELKNPLTALSLHIQLLDERLRGRSPTESPDDLLSVLKTEICRLNGVLEGFRSFASLQRLHLQPLDVPAVLDESLRLISPQAANQGVQIQFSRPETELPLVPLDSQKFQQAVLNLLINALEAMPGGGTLSLRTGLETDRLSVEVSDTGSGIPAELQEKMFKPYFSTKTQGTGMGLALTEKLIGQHGGQVGFESGPQGTTFRITLPLEPPRDEA
ncbi:MAG: PAS domain-containing protein [Candidatus Anammoximicrobium sp.]|nr:PAS domain-containing protein [Candidatus Anammoximicrobium sp.]